MLQFFHYLLRSDFMPHGYCIGWNSGVLWLHVISDAVIALSYFLIPFTLIYLVRARRDLDFRWMAMLFGVFILSCGATHVLGIVTLWHPIYIFEGWVKALTAISSLPTAVLLLWLAPKAISWPSPPQLRAANDEVTRLNRELEHRVEERTAALVEAEQRYRQLFESSPLPMWVREPEGGRFLAVNRAAMELYGYTESEFLAMTVKTLVAEGEIPKTSGDLRKPLLQRHVRKSGPPIWAEVRFCEMKFGAETAWLALSTDITERKALEEQLRHSQKMEAVGRLAGGIAHDFNNLLTVILGYASAALGKLESGSPIRRYLDEIQRAADHAASLTGQLLAFSRKQVTQPRVLDLNTEVRGMQDILHRVLGEDVRLDVLTLSRPCLVQADAGQLSQVMMNLAVNARDAMPRGGRLSIETNMMMREGASAETGSVHPPGLYCLLIVSDTGAGMDAETQSHIFEPFFTTKQPGSGTGLGLSTVYGIVAQHGGWIDLYSELGAGTTFRIYFPAAKENLAKKIPASAQSREFSTATILLVEDQIALRALAEEMLIEAGHKVLSAGNGREALQLAQKQNGSIDLLITDVVMPEMSGPELAEQLHRTRPELIVLFVSGYTDHALLQRGAIERGTVFLQKPFQPSTLLAKVAELLLTRNTSKKQSDDLRRENTGA